MRTISRNSNFSQPQNNHEQTETPLPNSTEKIYTNNTAKEKKSQLSATSPEALGEGVPVLPALQVDLGELGARLQVVRLARADRLQQLDGPLDLVHLQAQLGVADDGPALFRPAGQLGPGRLGQLAGLGEPTLTAVRGDELEPQLGQVGRRQSSLLVGARCRQGQGLLEVRHCAWRHAEDRAWFGVVLVFCW